MKSLFSRLFVVAMGLGIALLPAVAQVSLQQIPFAATNTTLLAQTHDIETLLEQAEQYAEQGKPQQAIETFQQVLKLAQQEGDKANEATALLGLGFNYHNIGQVQPALKNYEQALLIFREIKDRSKEAVTLNNIGTIYDDIGKPEEALKFYSQALLIRREVSDSRGEATTLNNIGTIYDDIGKPEEALKFYNQALSIFREIGNRRGEATTLSNIGAVYDSIGKSEEALNFYNQALPIRIEVGDRGGEAATLTNIGVVYNIIGKLEEALKFYNQALPIFKEIGDRRGEAVTLNNIGNIYDNIGKPEEALKFYSQALPIRIKVGDRGGEATTLANIGNISYNIGELEQALKFYKQALSITREVGDRNGEALILNNIGGIFHNIGKPEEALKYYNQALPILKEVGDHGNEATTLSNIGLVYRDTNRPTEAISNWEESLKITLEFRGGLTRDNRKAFIEVNDNTALALIDLLIKQNQDKKAYEWANLVTTFDLADYTRLINAQVANPEAQKEIDQWNELYQQLTSLLNQQEKNKQLNQYSIELAKRINEIQAQANQKAEDIAKKYPEAAELFETTPTDIKKLQQNIPQNTVVIQPVLLTGIKNTSNTVALFVLTHDNIQVIPKDLPDNFDQLVTDFRQQLENYHPETKTSTQLYDILIRPVEEAFPIPSGYQVAIIATGQLRNIPFEPLLDSQTDKYLLEKYPVSYLTRLSKTQNGINKSTNQKQPLTVLALANPKPTQEELGGTEAEADYIMQNFPGSQGYRHEQATLDKFQEEALRFSILHLGTHGCFVREGCPKLGMKPNTLLFANNQQYPIADAALLGLTKTELLVLSACQTAQLTEVEGVGLSGLAYVWERAGAKTIIASLWNATDKFKPKDKDELIMVSSEIMTKFYANLKQGMSKAEAMRQAKLSLINRHPYFWSPFILIGDAQ